MVPPTKYWWQAVIVALVLMNTATPLSSNATSGSLGPQIKSKSHPPYISRMNPKTDPKSFQIWSKSHMYFGCLVQKAGCKSWLHAIRSQHLPLGKALKLHTSPLLTFSKVNHPKFNLFMRRNGAKKSRDGLYERMENETASVINNSEYFKFAIVRHPWNRLVSAFRDKYVLHCNFSRVCFRESYLIPIQTSPLDPLTLTELLKTLLTMDTLAINEHFQPASYACETGSIAYDYIGDIDNSAHMDELSQILGFSQRFSEMTSSSGNVLAFPSFACTHRTVAMAERLYVNDATQFGYTFSDVYTSCTKTGLSS